MNTYIEIILKSILILCGNLVFVIPLTYDTYLSMRTKIKIVLLGIYETNESS